MDSTDPNIGVPAASASLPQARLRAIRPGWWGVLAASYMWLLTLVCLVVAIGLVWWSMPEQGLQITIRFPEGHGLEAEDTVRFRGIEVGTVEQIQLNRNLASVDVTVNLKPFAEPIARQGSRFWIVRPELSLSEISGLDTAVGRKYIGVLPGDTSDSLQFVFDGLANAPPDATDQEGVEIILRGEKRFGINPGSPLSYRGVVVGRVLSVDLSPDGRYVDSRVRVYQTQSYLVTSRTVFWASSGVDLDLKWGSGLKVDVESLETIAKGGVSMLTIDAGGTPIRPGQLFTLNATAEDNWYSKSSQVAATSDRNLRAAVALETNWKQTGLFGTSSKSAMLVATHLQLDGKSTLLFPSDGLALPEKGVAGSLQVRLADLDQLLDVNSARPIGSGELVLIETPELPFSQQPFSEMEIRERQPGERCVAVRSDGNATGRAYLHLPIDANQIAEDGAVKDFVGDRNVWHGAPVVAEQDGKLVGVLLVEGKQARLASVSLTPDVEAN